MKCVFEYINALGSLGTFLSFLFLLVKDKMKEKQINSLIEMVALLKNQNEISETRLKLSVAPDLYLGDCGGMTTSNGELKIPLINKGECAVIDSFTVKSGDITINDTLPFELDKSGQKHIVAKRASKNKSINECEYEIEVLYHDSLNNKYSITISGKGANAKITPKKEIK